MQLFVARPLINVYLIVFSADSFKAYDNIAIGLNVPTMLEIIHSAVTPNQQVKPTFCTFSIECVLFKYTFRQLGLET